MTSSEAPAPSMLTSTSVRHGAGIWVNAAVRTPRSAAVKRAGGPLGRAVAGFAAPDPSDDPWRARVAASVGHLQQLQATTAATLKRATATGRSELARQLELVAGLVEARIPTRVFSASLGGFDTHADERGTQERLLGLVDAALSGFARRMAASEVGRWWCWCTRSSGDGSGRTPATAPITARQARCSCSATRCAGACMASSRA